MSKTPKKYALFVIPADVANGAERVTAHYAQALARLPDWEVTLHVVCSQRDPSFGSSLTASGINVVYGPHPRERASLPVFIWGLSKKRYDFVFASILHINGILSFARRIGWLKTGRLVTRESNVFADRYVGIERTLRLQFLRMYGGQDLIVTQTEHMAARLRPILRSEFSGKITVVPNPIDTKAVQDKALIPLDPSLHDLLTRRPFIVWMGRLIDWKRPNVAVDVLSLVRKKTGMDVGLAILGAGPLMEDIQRHVQSSGLEDHVILLGRQENPFSIARLCRVGLSTSLALEGFPNVILEMMAAGLPSIVTTPGADGLSQLSGVHVTSGFGAHEIAELVSNALEDGATSSNSYMGSLHSRHPDTLIHRLFPTDDDSEQLG